MTGQMVIAGLLYETAFAGSTSFTQVGRGCTSPGPRWSGLRAARKMLVTYALLLIAYQCVGSELHAVYENGLAKSMGYAGSVCTMHYVERALMALLLLSMAGTVSPDPGGRNSLLGSVLCNAAHIALAWVAVVIQDVQVARCLVALAAVAYLVAAWEQLTFAWRIRRCGPTGSLRAALVASFVLLLGAYGVVYLLTIFGRISPSAEQNFHCMGGLVAQISYSVLLVYAREVEDCTFVEGMLEAAANAASDLERLISTASVPVFGIDQEYRVNEWNERMAEVTGLLRLEALGTPLLELVQEDQARQQFAKALEAALRGEHVGAVEVRLRAKDGSGTSKVATLAAVPAPMRGDRGQVVGVLGIGHDLTGIKAAREAETRKARLMAVVSHELKSPLHGIIGLSDSLGNSERDHNRAKQLGMVRSCAVRLLDLVVNIMEMASTTSQDGSAICAPKRLSRDRVNLPRILEEVVLLAKNATDRNGNPLLRKGVQLVNEVKSTVPAIEADAHKCTQVFYNIVANACKFTRQGKITIFSSADAERQWVDIGVADTGKGIAIDAQERIFQPFEQEDNPEHKQHEGIGLGLAIANEVVQRHGGRISLQSQVNVGTTFVVRLPVRMAQTEGHAAPEALHSSGGDATAQQALHEACRPIIVPATDPPLRPEALDRRAEFRSSRSEFRSTRSSLASASEASTSKRKPLVLSVDDDQVNQTVIEAALADEYDIHAAYDGHEAMEYFNTHSRLPDVMLLDVMMPGMTGFEVCQKVREELNLSSTQLPIVMLSARSPITESVIEGLQRGCNDYISKPFEKEMLRARVRAALQMKRLHEVELENASKTQLLYSIMPSHIVERLQAGESMIAESHESVTILFSDIVGWTNIAESLTTSQVVVLLNDLFSAFDELTEHHEVYKVETIGDAYMCAAGHDGTTEHALRIVRFGLAMVQAASRVRPPAAGLRLQIRVGAHTGPAYTGVVGRKVPRYCFFGDTVNCASRMESHGLPSCIHISQNTRDALGEKVHLGPGVQIIERGTVDIKGKGAMTTHLILPPGTPMPSQVHMPPKAVSRRGSVANPDLSPGSGTGRSPSLGTTPATPKSIACQDSESAAEEQKAEREAVGKLREELAKLRAEMEAESEGFSLSKVAAEREVALLQKANQAEAATCEELRSELHAHRREVEDGQRAAEAERRLLVVGAWSAWRRALAEARLEAAAGQTKRLEAQLAEAAAGLASARQAEGALRAASAELATGREQNRVLTERLTALEAERREAMTSASQTTVGDSKDREFHYRYEALEAERRVLREANAQLARRLEGVGAAPTVGGGHIIGLPMDASLHASVPGSSRPAASSPGGAASLGRLVEAKEQQVAHLRLELKLKDEKLRAARAALAALAEESAAKDSELQHALLDLRLRR